MGGMSEVRWVMLCRARDGWNSSMRVVDGDDDQVACGGPDALDAAAPFETAAAAAAPILAEAGYTETVPWAHEPPDRWGANLTVDR